MIQDKTIDETLIELMRCQRALEALRSQRKTCERICTSTKCTHKFCVKTGAGTGPCTHCGGKTRPFRTSSPVAAAAKRASLDLTRKLADLRAGR